MTDNQRPRGEQQAALWSGSGAQGWVASQALLDQVYGPFDDVLVDAALSRRPRAVLDVGCGTGSTTVAVARRLGASGSATGVDVAPPMIEAARARAEREGVEVCFVVGDAQEHPFERERYDALVSRFGVMFFDDPVRAFENLRRGAKAGASLTCVVWRSEEDNPFMTAAERAAAPLLPDLPPRRPEGPGQFAFADRDRVRQILVESGWSAADLRPLDVPCAMPEGALTGYLTRLGPVGRRLQHADDELRARVIAAVRPAFDPYVDAGFVRFTAACWLVTARA